MNRLIAPVAAATCIVAGVYMLTISTQDGETIFEAMAHGMGIYFIGKGLFVWALLERAGRQVELAGKSVELQGHQHLSGEQVNE